MYATGWIIRALAPHPKAPTQATTFTHTQRKVQSARPSNVGCTYLFTYSMEQSPSWEANRFSESRNSPHFMEPEGSLLHSKVPTTCPYPEPNWSSPYPPHPTSWRSILVLSYHLRLGLPSGLFLSGFPTRTFYMPLLSPMWATCPDQLDLLHFITQTILGEEYRSLSSSLCTFLHSPITLSLLGPNILLSTLFSNNAGLHTCNYLYDLHEFPIVFVSRSSIASTNWTSVKI